MRPVAPRRLPPVVMVARVAMLGLMVTVLAACTSMTGGPAGEHVDDAQITAAVKAKLAADKLAPLTRVGVETRPPC